MIARHETHMDKMDIWSKLSAPLPPGVISWRQDGRPVQRDGKHVARFVAYIDANTVRERLDGVVPGEWDLTLELLPSLAQHDENGEPTCSFNARLQILGVIREDVGTGRDYKSAATDAFKRAAVRFGVANELYDYEQNWVQVDSDSKYARPVEDPGEAYARRMARAQAKTKRRADRTGKITEPVETAGNPQSAGGGGALEVALEVPTHAEVRMETLSAVAAGPLALDEPSCPKCGGRMWDNRLSKRNPKAPDYKCRNRSCDGVIWPLKGGNAGGAPGPEAVNAAGPLVPDHEHLATVAESDEIPF
jgi:hypothetical protein